MVTWSTWFNRRHSYYTFSNSYRNKKKMRDLPRKILIAIAILLGILIGYIDSKPGWDDTGITVGFLLFTTGVLSFFSPKRPWVFALAVGIWIPLFSIFFTHNYAGLIALVFSTAGAYSGMFLRKITSADSNK